MRGAVGMEAGLVVGRTGCGRSGAHLESRAMSCRGDKVDLPEQWPVASLSEGGIVTKQPRAGGNPLEALLWPGRCEVGRWGKQSNLSPGLGRGEGRGAGGSASPALCQSLTSAEDTCETYAWVPECFGVLSLCVVLAPYLSPPSACTSTCWLLM